MIRYNLGHSIPHLTNIILLALGYPTPIYSRSLERKKSKHFVFNKYISLILGVLKSKISKKIFRASYSSDFAYRLYTSLLVKKLKIKFVQKGLVNFSEILDLSSPNTREKYLLKTKCLDFFLSKLRL